MSHSIWWRRYLSVIFGLLAGIQGTQATAASPTLHLAGDSTMAIKAPYMRPETGWGEPFADFFAAPLRIHNHAMNGRSTRTFLEEGRWQALLDALNAGDFVLIQFGHNDESRNKPDRYTTPEAFKQNLQRFVADVRAKQATPILLTPLTRRQFDADGKVLETHEYSSLVREVAQQAKVSWIDLDALSRAHFAKMGIERSAARFLHLAAGEHPFYPAGVSDNTHLSPLGASEVAILVLRELQRQQSPLLRYQRPPDPKRAQPPSQR